MCNDERRKKAGEKIWLLKKKNVYEVQKSD